MSTERQTVQLSRQQQTVLARRGDSVLVRAGPGSGKTRTLVAKLLDLIDEGVAPERVLALTFSKKAADEMRHRVEEATRRSHRALWISTFHSFGHALLQRFPTEAGVPRSFRLLTGFKEWVLLRDVLERVGPKSALATALACRGLVGDVANAVGTLKQSGVAPEAFAEWASKRTGDAGADRALLAELASVYVAYEEQLRARRHFDYRDLVHRARRLLEEHAEIRSIVQGWFDAVLIDELQDIDAMQLGLVAALVQGSPLARAVTACGDPDQSIYGFRGARPDDVLRGLREALPGIHEVALTENFRAHPDLITVSRRLLGAAVPSHAVRVDPGPASREPRVHVIEAPTSLAEATAIARALRRARREGRADGAGTYRWRDMAVLCRSLKRDARAIENELQRLAIPYRVLGNVSFYRNPAVSFLVNYLLALADDDDDRPLRRVLASPIPGLPQLALARFLDRVTRRDRHAGRYLWFLRFLLERDDPEAFPVYRPDKEDTAEADGEVAAERKENASIRAPYFYELMSRAEKEAFYAFHQRFVSLRARARRGRDALPALVAAVAARSGLTSWILALAETDSRTAERHAANVSKLHAMGVEFTEIARERGSDHPPTLADLAAHLKQLLAHFAHESEVDAPAAALYEPEDAVSVMTVHQAKGLEFDVVVVPHLVIGRFPAAPRPRGLFSSAAVASLRAAHPGFHDPGQVEPERHFAEERRLAYVAWTRARERLILTWARRLDGEEEDSAPSPFLIESLGGDERSFWSAVQDGGEPPGRVLAGLAAPGGDPPITYADVDEHAWDLADASSRDEAEVALRRLYRRGDEALRERVSAIVRPENGRGRAGIDWSFVSSASPLPPEEPRGLGLDPERVVLSASRLADYRDCPRKFFYSKLLHLEAPARARAIFGTTVHEVLERFHEAHPDKEALRDPARAPAFEAELREALRAALHAERERFGSEFQYRRQLDVALGLVSPYLQLQRHEPLRWVAGRELELTFDAAGARLIAKLDRVVADAPELGEANEVLIADYKTVRSAVNKGRSLAKRIVDGKELQLVTYYRAFEREHGRPPTYLGLVYLRHEGLWRDGTQQTLLRVMPKARAKGTDWWGLAGRKWTDRGHVAAEDLDAAWTAIEDRIRDILDPGRDRFEITPSPGVCRLCAFAAICGKE